MLKTEVEGEMEFLFAPYSMFTVRLLWARVKQYRVDCDTTVLVFVQVIRTDFSPQDWSDRNARYTVCIEAAIDANTHEKDLELAPWY